MSIQEIRVPDIGNYADVEIIEVAVAVGADVKAEETLITLETEKASMDVPCPVNGKLKELKVKLGDKVSKGDLIALVEVEEDKSTAPESAVSDTETIAVPGTEAPIAVPGTETTVPGTGGVETITVPDTGGAQEIEVIEVSVKVGDEIKTEDTIITLESEKASMDIPSPFTGKIESVLVKVGDKVSMGTQIATIKAVAVQAEKSAAPTPAADKSSTETTAATKPAAPRAISAPAGASFDNSQVHAGPATRRLARELGVDLTRVPGTGMKNRIITQDVQAYVKAILQGGAQAGGLSIEKAPEIDFSQFGEIEVKPLGRIKKWTAKNLHRNWVTIPHVTQFDEADITELEIFRSENKQAAEEQGIKLTPLAFIIQAVVSALKTYPQFNASLAANGSDLVFKKYFNIGVAVETPNGLVVPVLKDADNKSLFDLAKELGQLSGLARDGKLKNDQMQGNCFSITSLGGIGGTAFTPIINAPDVAILGISKAQIKPVFVDDQFVPRRMLPLSLSYDHRVIDGAEAARFITHIASQLQDIRKLLL